MLQSPHHPCKLMYLMASKRKGTLQGREDSDKGEGCSPPDPPPTPLERPASAQHGIRLPQASSSGGRKSFKQTLPITELLFLLFFPPLWRRMLLQKHSSCKVQRGCSARRIRPSSRWWLREPTSTLLRGSTSHSSLWASRPISKEHRWEVLGRHEYS